MKQQSWIILTLVFAVIIAVFAVINVEAVQVDFLFTETDAPLILVILFSALLGALLVTAFSISKFYQMKREIKVLSGKETKDESATEPKDPQYEHEDDNSVIHHDQNDWTNR
ncbi:LapA family protein [Halalkalibacillus halophilus]|uniref:LapA family protein n=1 Tax=Halalkalibacillus halophilus TaxID=392827 RepID=UPI0003F60A70|nr:lipopolysaccharide assembly protein LapA domain-containing protein [Halalkalibacillus halophilus]